MPIDVVRAVALHKEISERIASAFHLAEDDPFLIDTVQGESDLEAALAKVMREAKQIEAMAAGIDDILDTAKARQTRMRDTVERLRGIVAWAMDDIGLKKIIAPDMTLSVRPGKAKLVIDDEPRLPPELTKVEMKVKPDRDAIVAAFDAGQPVPGCRMANGSTVLTVRTR